MPHIGTIARRTFLLGSAAIAGGVAFGTYLAKKPIGNPLLDDLGADEAAITPHVKIDASGVTLITPRADKGQGAYSIQAHLIAEELDVDPAKTTLSPGKPGPAYYNRVVLSDGVPFPGYVQTPLAEAMRDFTSVPAKLFQFQVTGGSSTVPDGYTRLRLAGAVARETLKEAAAQRSGFARAELNTEDGHVIVPTGERIAYTDLAVEAAQIRPVEDVTLRPSSEWKRLGKSSMQRTDMVAKCTGTERYGIDLQIEGMLYATVRANPGFGGDVVRFDAAKAETMRGVQRVVPIRHGIGVIADNTWRAFRAAEAIEVEWSSAIISKNSKEIFEKLESVIDDADHYDHRKREEGDVEAALSDDTALMFEATYQVPYLAHAPLEPMNAIAQVREDRVDIWTGTQIPLFIRDRAVKLTGLSAEAVHVHVQPMGGSFGGRLEMTHVEQAIELAMAVKGTPVKMTWSREEDMTHDYPRPGAVAKGRGTVKDGQVEAFDLSIGQSALTQDWFGRLIGMNIPGPDATITTGSWDQPFAIPHYRVTGYRAPAMVPVSSWRSVGASGNGFFHDCMLDELIHAAGADPLAERIRLCLHDTSRQVLETVGEMSGWTGPDLGPNRGRGIGFCMSFGVPCAIVTEVTQTETGITIDKVFVVADVGEILDPSNLEAQLFGGALFGLGHAMNCQLTHDGTGVEQTNYHAYQAMRLYQTPLIEVKALANGTKIRGVGEPGVPPAAPSLANAIFAATGQRIRSLPLNTHIDFV